MRCSPVSLMNMRVLSEEGSKANRNGFRRPQANVSLQMSPGAVRPLRAQGALRRPVKGLSAGSRPAALSAGSSRAGRCGRGWRRSGRSSRCHARSRSRRLRRSRRGCRPGRSRDRRRCGSPSTKGSRRSEPAPRPDRQLHRGPSVKRATRLTGARLELRAHTPPRRVVPVERVVEVDPAVRSNAGSTAIPTMPRSGPSRAAAGGRAPARTERPSRRSSVGRSVRRSAVGRRASGRARGRRRSSRYVCPRIRSVRAPRPPGRARRLRAAQGGTSAPHLSKIDVVGPSGAHDQVRGALRAARQCNVPTSAARRPRRRESRTRVRRKPAGFPRGRYPTGRNPT